MKNNLSLPFFLTKRKLLYPEAQNLNCFNQVFIVSDEMHPLKFFLLPIKNKNVKPGT